MFLQQICGHVETYGERFIQQEYGVIHQKVDEA